MSHDVFISYASEDKAIAFAICDGLEQSKIVCWIAPRNICAGEEWAAAITSAIANSKVMVLVFSAHSNKSKYVLREADRAVSSGIPIVTIRTSDLEPTGGLELYTATLHWLDAFGASAKTYVPPLVEAVAGRINGYPASIVKSEEAIQHQPDVSLPTQTETRVNRPDGAEMIWIPPGEFLMGDVGYSGNLRKTVDAFRILDLQTPGNGGNVQSLL